MGIANDLLKQTERASYQHIYLCHLVFAFVDKTYPKTEMSVAIHDNATADETLHAQWRCIW